MNATVVATDRVAQAWVEGFAEGWRAPGGPDRFAAHFRPISWRACDRVTLCDGVAVERESYFDPGTLLAAVARAPRAWPALLSMQARNFANNLARRRRS
jgi:hypothetical protein